MARGEAPGGTTRRRRRWPARLAAAAIALALLWAALVPHRLTDGDSCLHAAMARAMADGGGAAWVAPRWAHDGAWTWYRDQPPGAFWPAAVLGFVLSGEAAARTANVLWTVLAAWAVGALARTWLSPRRAWLAVLVFLLHAPVLRSVQRFTLEPALVAATAGAVVAALRLHRSRGWAVLLALALAAAFLVRGVFGGIALGLVGWIALDPRTRPSPRRLLAAVLGAGLLLLLFDRAHAAVTGEGFWVAYVARQVAPSLVAAGGAHGREGRQFLYFGSRFLLYGLPWILLPAARVLARRPLRPPSAWRLAAVWVLGTWVGASLTVRPASRYLYAAWAATALLAALAWPRRPALFRRAVRWAPALAVLVFLGTLAAKTPNVGGPWTRTANLLHARAAAGPLPLRVGGPFDPEDSRLKSLIRCHLGVPAVSGPAGPGGWTWRPAGESPPPGAHVVLETPLGRLVEDP